MILTRRRLDKKKGKESSRSREVSGGQTYHQE